MTPVDFDIGLVAESSFNRWCAEAGIVATRPALDRNGWDYLINLPASSRIDLLKSPPAMTAYVQVKGHLGKDLDTPSIKLSNWERMIQEPIPWFVCIVLIDERAQATQCALVHIGKVRVEAAARRIWKNLAGENKPTNTLELVCPWGQEDLLPSLHGVELSKAIRSHIGDSHQYFARKSAWYQNAGIEDAKHSLTFKFPKDLSEQQLCDFALGKIPELPVAKLEVSHMRFGIPRPESTHEDVKISMSQPRSLGTTAMRFTRITPPRERLEIQFETFTSLAIFPFLSEPYHRIRLTAPPLSVEIWHSADGSRTNYQYQLSAAFEEEVRLSALESSCRMIRILREDPSAVTEFRLPSETEWQALASPEVSGSFGDDPADLLMAAPNAAIAARVFGLDPSSVFVAPADLIERSKYFEILAGLHAGGSPAATLTLECRSPDDERLIDQTIARVVVVGSELGEHYLVQCIAFHGRCRKSPSIAGLLEVEHPVVETLERRVLDKSEMSDVEADDFVRDMAERGRQLQKDKGRRLLIVRGEP